MEYQKMLLGENPYFVSCVRHSYPTHCHNEMELMFCISGEVRVVIEDDEYYLHEDDVLMISSLAMHQFIIEKDAAVLVLEFGSQFLGAGYKEYAKLKFTKSLIATDDDCAYRNRLVKPLKRLYKEYVNKKTGSQWAIQGLLFEIFAMIVRYVPMEQQKLKNQKNLEQYLKIQKAFDLVHGEYAEDISLERVAAYLGYDKRTFCRIFKSITNMTFHEYLNFYRINIAMQLLEHKAHAIGEIGQMVGIPVAKSFSRIFRKYTGMSPKEYRNTHLIKEIDE